MEQTAPELIVTKEVTLHPGDVNKTVIKQLNYTAFIYVVINAVKELYKDLLQLKTDQAVLSRQLASKADSEEVAAKFRQLATENAKLKEENELFRLRLEKIEKSLNTNR